MIIGNVTSTNRIRQTVSGFSYCRKVQTLSAELPTSAITQTASGQFPPVLPNEKLLVEEELERSRLELETRRLISSKTEGDV